MEGGIRPPYLILSPRTLTNYCIYTPSLVAVISQATGDSLMLVRRFRQSLVPLPPNSHCLLVRLGPSLFISFITLGVNYPSFLTGFGVLDALLGY